jgi:hypothetical protein
VERERERLRERLDVRVVAGGSLSPSRAGGRTVRPEAVTVDRLLVRRVRPLPLVSLVFVVVVIVNQKIPASTRKDQVLEG